MMTLHDLRAEPRSLPVALAQQLAACRPKDPRLALLNSLYLDLSPADALRCRAEIHAIRCARRGETPAVPTPSSMRIVSANLTT